jgi:hypothetical protein
MVQFEVFELHQKKILSFYNYRSSAALIISVPLSNHPGSGVKRSKSAGPFNNTTHTENWNNCKIGKIQNNFNFFSSEEKKQRG